MEGLRGEVAFDGGGVSVGERSVAELVVRVARNGYVEVPGSGPADGGGARERGVGFGGKWVEDRVEVW